MRRDYRYSAKAQQDVEDIWLYHARQSSPEAADIALDNLRETVHRTVFRFPNGGRKRAEFGVAVRSFPIPPYIVFYETTPRLRILRVLHGQRDIKGPLMSFLVAISA